MLTGQYKQDDTSTSGLPATSLLWSVVPNGAAAASLKMSQNASWNMNNTELADVLDPSFWRRFCSMDSDGDGETNGLELGDPCCLWKPGLETRAGQSSTISNPFDPTSVTGRPNQDCRAGLCIFAGQSTGFLVIAVVLIVLGGIAAISAYVRMSRISIVSAHAALAFICSVACIAFGSICLDMFVKCYSFLNGGYLETNLQIEWEWAMLFQKEMALLTWFGSGLIFMAFWCFMWLSETFLSKPNPKETRKSKEGKEQTKKEVLLSSSVVLVCLVPFVLLRYFVLPTDFHGGSASDDTIFFGHGNGTALNNNTRVCSFIATPSSSRIAFIYLACAGTMMLLIRTGYLKSHDFFWNGHWNSQSFTQKMATVAFGTIPMVVLCTVLISAAGYMFYFRARCTLGIGLKQTSVSFSHFVWGMLLYSCVNVYNFLWASFFSLVDVLASSLNLKFAQKALSQVFYGGVKYQKEVDREEEHSGTRNRAIQLNTHRHGISVIIVSLPTYLWVAYDVPRELLLNQTAAYFSTQDRGIIALTALGLTFFALQLFTNWLFYTQHSKAPHKPWDMAIEENKIHMLVYAIPQEDHDADASQMEKEEHPSVAHIRKGPNPNRFGNCIEIASGLLLWMNLTAANFMPTLPYGTESSIQVNGLLGKMWVKIGEGFAASLFVVPLDDEARANAFYIGFWIFFVMACNMPFYVLPFFGHYDKVICCYTQPSYITT